MIPVQPLKHHHPEKEIQTFINTVNQRISELNLLIEHYNELPPELISEKQQQLMQIHMFYQAFYVLLSPTWLRRYKPYEDMLKQVFLQIQETVVALGLSSAYDLKQVSSEHINLICCLSNKDPDDFNAMISKPSVSSLEAMLNFTALGNQILREYEITSLEDRSSRTFQLKNRSTSTSCILNIRCCNESLEKIIAWKQHPTLQSFFAPRYVSKYVVAATGVYEISLTDFYRGKLKHYPQYSDDSSMSYSQVVFFNSMCYSQVVFSALRFFTQMSIILLALQEAGYPFSNLENDDWTIDNQGHLRLTDTKLLSGLFYSPYLNERSKHEIAETYSSILGRNLHQYLVDEIPITSVIEKPLNDVIIQLSEGPQNRQTLIQGSETLHQLWGSLLRTKISHLLELLYRDARIADEDSQLDAFIAEQKSHENSNLSDLFTHWTSLENTYHIAIKYKPLRAVRFEPDAIMHRGLQSYLLPLDALWLEMPIPVRFSPENQIRYANELSKIYRFSSSLKTYKELLNKIASLRFGNDDVLMDEWIQKKKRDLEDLTPPDHIDIEALENDYQQLEPLFNKFTRQLPLIKMIVNKHPSLNEEARQLKHKLLSTPMAERKQHSSCHLEFNTSLNLLKQRALCMDLLIEISTCDTSSLLIWMNEADTPEKLTAFQTDLTWRNQCLHLLSAINQHKFGPHDDEMSRYLDRMKYQIVHTRREPMELFHELSLMHAHLEATTPLLKQIINDFEHGSCIKLRMRQKASKIEQTICEVRVEYRTKKGLLNSLAARPFRKALAANRHITGLYTSLNTTTGMLDMEHIASSYSRFFDVVQSIAPEVEEVPLESTDRFFISS